LFRTVILEESLACGRAGFFESKPSVQIKEDSSGMTTWFGERLWRNPRHPRNPLF
jgi:hypothetical protein